MTAIKHHIPMLLTTGKAFFDTPVIKNRRSKALLRPQQSEALKRWEEDGGSLALPLAGENHDFS